MTEQVSLGSWGEEKGERFGIRGGILVLVCSLSPWQLSLLGHLPQTLGRQVSSLKEHQSHLEGFVHWLPDTLPRVSDPKVLGGTWESGQGPQLPRPPDSPQAQVSLPSRGSPEPQRTPWARLAEALKHFPWRRYHPSCFPTGGPEPGLAATGNMGIVQWSLPDTHMFSLHLLE